jgi:phage terminase large subunit-like protein
MGRNTRRLKPKPFSAPKPLFPITGEVTGPLDMIPIGSDPTGRGARAWKIFSNLTITEGEHAGKRIGENAPPWQERLVKLIFGHTDELGRRLLQEIFACISKKNGKSSFAAALALTKLLMNEEQRELVVCLAANRMQARLVFDTMVATIKADEALTERFEIVEHRHTIKYLQTHSQVRAISAELASIIGGNPSLTIVDELHLLGATPKGAKLLNQARTGSVARKEPLLVSISTAPVDRSEGIFESTYQKARRVISGEEVDPRFFAWLCQIPDSLDPEDPANWHWSNPSLGYTVTVERLTTNLHSARSDPVALRDFRSQNLNISPDDSAGIDRWLSLKEWDSASDRLHG